MIKYAAIALFAITAGTASAGISAYSEDFEALDAGAPDSLGNAGWLVGANVWGDAARTAFLYNYFTFPAGNGGPNFSAIATGEGGAPQGAQQLSAYSDYNNADHGNGLFIEANLFQEWIIDGTTDAGDWTFEFDAKKGDADPSVEVVAFIKVLDPNAGFALTRFETLDMQVAGADGLWGTHSLTTDIDASLAGQIFQIGWFNTATNFTPSGFFYDNVNLSVVPAPAGAALFGMAGLAAARRRRS